MKKITMLLATAIAFARFGSAVPAVAQAASAVEREGAAREVANLMSRRSILLARGDDEGMFALFASKQPDVTVVMVGRRVRGIDNIRKTLPAPLPGPPGTGQLTIHGLLSPIIEVAEDGKTAKGFWQSAGPVVFARGGPATGALSFENYGVDFIREDGQWKIWHIAIIRDVALPLPSETLASFATPPVAGPAGGSPAESSINGGRRNAYPDWTPGRPTPTYPLPVPYRTFSETFSYGDFGTD